MEFSIHKSPPKRWFRYGIHSLLRRANARGSADTIYRMWRTSLLCESGLVIDVTSRSHMEYLIPTNNISASLVL